MSASPTGNLQPTDSGIAFSVDGEKRECQRVRHTSIEPGRSSDGDQMRKPRDKLAQILPAVRYMPKLPIEATWASALTDLVVEAMVANGMVFRDGEEPLAALFAPARGQLAAQFYVSAKLNETPLPEFRRMIDGRKKNSLAAAVARLLSLLQVDSRPPFPQMEALYCNADPAIDGLDRSGGDVEEPNEALYDAATDDYDDDQSEPVGIWREKFSPAKLRTILTTWLGLTNELYHRIGGSAPGRSPIEAEIMFVSMLAANWSGEFSLPLSSGRGTSVHGNAHDQQGLFAEFVRKCAEIIPAEFRPHSWDHGIRIVCGEKT
jgi:hypothetical protein